MKATRSVSTSKLYETAIRSWCQANEFPSPDDGIRQIKAKKDPELAGIESINRLVAMMTKKQRAPKTVNSYASATKKYLAYEDVSISQERFRAKTVLPQIYDVSIDTIPTDEQMRMILLNASTAKSKALITLLASSGLRIGEAQKLKVGYVAFDKHPAQITIPARHTKTKANRVTFISDEAAEFLKTYLGARIENSDSFIFPGDEPDKPAYRGGLIDLVERAILKARLRYKIEKESARYALHTHSFRKLFFSKCIGAGVDRGIVEAWMGHRFGLDGSYLRMGESDLAQEYLKAMPHLTFLSGTVANHEKLSSLSEEVENLKRELAERDRTIEELKSKIPTAEIEKLQRDMVEVRNMVKYIGPETVERYRRYFEAKHGRTLPKKARKL